MLDLESKEEIINFDGRYKTIIEFPIEKNYLEAIYWLNTNSKGNIKVEKKDDKNMYIGFEDNDDYILFEVKFM